MEIFAFMWPGMSAKLRSRRSSKSYKKVIKKKLFGFRNHLLGEKDTKDRLVSFFPVTSPRGGTSAGSRDRQRCREVRNDWPGKMLREKMLRESVRTRIGRQPTR